jgi:hypothetical protein
MPDMTGGWSSTRCKAASELLADRGTLLIVQSEFADHVRRSRRWPPV